MARVPNLFPRIAILWLVLLIGPPSNAVYLTARDSFEEARAAIKQEHWNGAANILEAILKKEPNHAGALSLLGRVRLAQHRPAEAIVILAKALEHDPSSPEALLSLSLANEEVGNADEALSYFHQATKAGTSDPELLLRLAETGYGRGLYGDAIHALQKARALDPANEQYTLFLATSHFARGDIADCLRLLQEVLRRNPRSPYGHFSRGYYLYKVGRTEEAAVSLRQCLELDPNFVEAKFHLAQIAEGNGDPDLARRLYDEILRARPEHANSFASLGRLALNDGSLAAAERHLLRCLALEPNHREAHYTLGLLYSRNGRVEDARKELARAEELRRTETGAKEKMLIGGGRQKVEYLDPGSTVAESLREAIAAQKRGQPAEAEQKYLRLLKLAPNLAEAYMNLGLLYHDENRLDEAMANLRKALELNPSLVGANYFLGIDLYLTSQFDPAVTALRQTLKVTQDIPDLHRWLGLSLLAATRYSEAAESLESQLKTAPDDREVIAALLKAYVRLSRRDAAHRMARLLAGKDSTTARIHQIVADAWLEAGEVEQAIPDLQTAVRLEREGPIAEESLEQLAQIYASLGRSEEEQRARRELEAIRKRTPQQSPK